jgi:hypothetical protein
VSDGPAAAPTDRFPRWLLYAALLLLGLVLSLWGAFLVPARLPGGVEGLADVVAVAGNLGVGYLAGRLTRDVPAAGMSGIGWLIGAAAALSYVKPSDEVVIPGKLGDDPGVAVVGTVFLLGGAAAAIVAVALVSRYTNRVVRPTSSA